MTRKQHLEYCKVCTLRKMDFKRGLLCSLTDEMADFDPTCSRKHLARARLSSPYGHKFTQIHNQPQAKIPLALIPLFSILEFPTNI